MAEVKIYIQDEKRHILISEIFLKNVVAVFCQKLYVESDWELRF